MDHATAFQLGIDLGDNPGTTQTEVSWKTPALAERQADSRPSLPLDHFIQRDGKVFAGHHLIIDLWGADNLNDKALIEQALTDAVDAAGATLLHIHLHHFTPEGVSGVAVLAESHISIHTWPERNYAALDVFMCGDAEPAATIPVLERAFHPTRTVVNTLHRGEVVPADDNTPLPG